MPKPRTSPVSMARAAKLNRPSASGRSGMEEARFLTIDLDVRSRRSLAPLVSAWPWAYQPVKNNGQPDSRWLILNARETGTAEAAANYLLGHVTKLRGDALLCWRQAHRRMFDVGIQAGGAGQTFEQVQFTAATLRRIAAVAGQMQITVYPAESKATDKRPSR